MAGKSKSATPKISTLKPKNIFLKPVTVNYRELFKALAKGVGHTIAQKWEELAADTVAAVCSLGLETEPGELAYELVQRALIISLFDLIADSSTLISLDPNKSEQDVIESIESLLLDEPIILDERFLDRPLNIPLVARTQSILRAWLEAHSSVASAGAVIAKRFPSYFVYAINNEWRKNENRYSSLKTALDTPFTKASNREWQWATYAALLNKRVEEPSFDEAFSLKQIFIAPFAYFHERPKVGIKNLEELSHGKERDKRIVVSLEDELESWLNNSGPEDAVRVLSGGPGSGKSSFSRVFAARLASEQKSRVLFVPLHLIDPLQDLSDEVGRFVKNEGIISSNPLDPESPEPNLLIIFDGLDELASQGKAAAEAARAFIGEVEKTVQRRSLMESRLRILISGRELVVQENQLDFRRDRQILNILPYYVSESDRESRYGPEYVDKSKHLKRDLRIDWWKNYGALTGRSYNGLPNELKRSDLDEITAQPLLNYLVALSFTRGEIDFSRDVNLNVIYDDLVSAVYERGYEKSRVYGPIKHLSAAEFARVLEEIGLAAWHGDGRTTTVAEIEQHCDNSGVGPLLNKFQDGAKAGVTRLLAAFFFRQHGQRSGGDQTFVFTHKSFGEFLAARRIARAMGRIVKETTARSESPDEGWDEREALKHWAMVCGPSAMTSYIRSFLKTEVRGLTNLTYCQTCFASLFDHILRFGMPMELLQLVVFREQQLNARNAEESLLVALNACAIVTKTLSAFPKATATAFGAWFRRIQGQRTGSPSVMAAYCLSYLDLRNYHLDILDLYDADLRFSDFRGVQAHFTNFGTAILDGADLRGAVFRGAYFGGAHLIDIKITSEDLEASALFEANFEAAVVSDELGATLKKLDLDPRRMRVRKVAHRSTTAIRK